MDFLIYGRAAARVEPDATLTSEHWSYMDGFADRMTARGPTLGADRQTWTGSLHVVDLAGPDAAREFVAQEPYQQAGRFAEHHIWRFTNLLGRTMWQFTGPADEPRFLVLARCDADQPTDWRPPTVAELTGGLRDGLILYGELRSLDDEHHAGAALAVQAPTRGALDALLGDERTRLTDHELEVQDWEFGGRR